MTTGNLVIDNVDCRDITWTRNRINMTQLRATEQVKNPSGQSQSHLYK
jgi:hypothetical protein